MRHLWAWMGKSYHSPRIINRRARARVEMSVAGIMARKATGKDQPVWRRAARSAERAKAKPRKGIGERRRLRRARRFMRVGEGVGAMETGAWLRSRCWPSAGAAEAKSS